MDAHQERQLVAAINRSPYRGTAFLVHLALLRRRVVNHTIDVTVDVAELAGRVRASTGAVREALALLVADGRAQRLEASRYRVLD